MVQPILAAELIEILAKGIPIILFVLWLIGQAVSEKQKQANQAKKLPRQPRLAPAQPKPQPAKAQRAATDIEDEIDAFLRRAAEKKGQAPPQREETVILLPQKEEARRAEPMAPAVPAAPLADTAAASTRPLGRPLSQRTENLQEFSRAAAAKSGAAPQPPRPAVLSYQETISAPLSLPLSQRQSHLGEVVALADDKLEAHLHQVFDHQVGRLQHRSAESDRKVSASPIARSVVELLKNPQGVQQMIVINEILRRPEV